jgi:hypothetical protein
MPSFLSLTTALLLGAAASPSAMVQSVAPPALPVLAAEDAAPGDVRDRRHGIMPEKRAEMERRMAERRERMSPEERRAEREARRQARWASLPEERRAEIVRELRARIARLPEDQQARVRARFAERCAQAPQAGPACALVGE